MARPNEYDVVEELVDYELKRSYSVVINDLERIHKNLIQADLEGHDVTEAGTELTAVLTFLVFRLGDIYDADG